MTQTEPANQGGEKSTARTLSRPMTIIVSVAIAGLAGLLVTLIYSSEPKAERESATRETAMLVEVTTARRGTFTPTISGLGTVTAAEDVMLSPRVAGRVTEIAKQFFPGGYAAKGETLLRLDPADYDNIVRQRMSDLRQAESALAQERGRRDVAERDFEVLGKTLDEANPALALREPQLEAAKARVAAAEVALAQARLDRERTEIKAPFDAQIITRAANIGSEVTPGTALARLVGVDEYHVIVTVPLAKLKQLHFPRNGEVGAPVLIRDRAAWADGQTREGRVLGLIGAIDGQTRMARVLVSVQDPLARQMAPDSPVLIVGSIVQADIEGKPLEGVVKIDRNHLRQGDAVWVKEDGKLDVREVAVAFRDTTHAYIASGLEDGDMLVTSNLATVVDGAPLRLDGAAPAQPAAKR